MQSNLLNNTEGSTGLMDRSMMDISHLPESLQYIIREIRNARNDMSPEKARDIVVASNVSESDLERWADYDHPDEDSYGRKLVYNEGFFEIMVMSWVPGDFSAIHDHGYTLWGAVKVFGPAEHCAYNVSDGMITTACRETFQPGLVIAVGHELVHQLGNPSEQRYLTLHMYGLYDPEFDLESVTANARVLDISTGRVERTDGGMFFGLPEDRIKTVETAPRPDFLSWLRNTTEYIKRMRRSGNRRFDNTLAQLTDHLYDPDNWIWLKRDIERYLNSDGHMINLHYYNHLRYELIHAARLQKEMEGERENHGDSFHSYAELYDEVIGRPCLKDFMSAYIRFASEKYGIDYSASKILSIGCGTAITERHMIDRYSIPYEHLLGIDNSAAMVKVASNRIMAKEMDILHMEGTNEWDVVFQGLNVFQYLQKPFMERAIQRAASLTRNGGYFIGDFVTPDHIRWYPHIMSSDNVISLRMPRLVERDKNTCQESEIINVSRLDGRFRISYEGKHLRYLPSVWKMRYIFKKVFRGRVDLYDARTLEPVRSRDDTTTSTRYIIIAQKE